MYVCCKLVGRLEERGGREEGRWVDKFLIINLGSILNIPKKLCMHTFFFALYDRRRGEERRFDVAMETQG